MTTAAAAPLVASPPGWTCPFCALLCEGFTSPADAAGQCPRARARIDALGSLASAAPLPVDATEVAIERAAERLASWRQPLFAGMATDVAGARALYRLAARTGAVCDHADGDGLMHGLRAVQDRGQYIATIGELRARAHTIVCFGTDPVTRWPRFFERLDLARDSSPLRKLVFVGMQPPAVATRAAVGHLPGSGDLFADVQQLAAWVARKPSARPPRADAAMAALADELLASPYAVLLWEGAALPAHGALIVEALNRIVGTLNQTTRAATFGLGGNDGAASVNQAFTWLSGLPLRTRVAQGGLAHDPHRYGTTRALADGAVDGVLWVHSFDATRAPPATTLPRIVLGPPAMAPKLGVDDVFIPVAVPGLHADAHLFRTDGPVMLHLEAPVAPQMMSVAQVATALLAALDARHGAPGAAA